MAAPPFRDRPPSQLGAVLERTLRSMDTPSVQGVEVVFERWSEVVGAAMAARTRPARIKGDILVVSCDEPAVATHLRYLESELVERLAKLSGERRIGHIEVQVARVARGARPRRA